MNWRTLSSRLAHMSWDEFRTRSAQELGKRIEFARYRCGLAPSPAPLQPAPATPPSFFFRRDDAPGRASLIRRYLPARVDEIIREADDLCRHRFLLLGYEALDYGAEIDWHLDAVHGKQAPLQAWYKIDFLDFAVLGDHKVIWEINRHQHLVTLAKAWLLTSNPAYIKELLSQWHGWQKANPYPLGINWASSLEVAFRSLSWLWVRSLIAGCPAVPVPFESELLIALQRNGEYIERYLSTYFSPNTHLLGEAVALFFIGVLCPQIRAAAGWRRRGWEIVLRESARQNRPDGVYFEQSLYYHVYALDFFLYARMLAARNGLPIPDSFDRALLKMLDVVDSLSGGGIPESFGDDDGGRLFDPRRNRTEHLTDALALGAVEYNRPDWATSGLTEEALWLFGENAVVSAPAASPERARRTKAFESGGIYLIRDSQPCRQQLMLDAGPQGVGRSGHGHADALSLRFSLGGQRCLIDSGTGCYVAGKDRDHFRGTGAHNTLRIDGLDQAVPQAPFAWSSIPRASVQHWLGGETFDLFEASHDGYCRLSDPVVHRRTVFHLHGGFWLVRDAAEGRQSHLVEAFWHLAPEFRVGGGDGMVTASPAGRFSDNDTPSLALLLAQPQTWRTEIASGRMSPAYGRQEPAPVVRFSATVQLPTECTVLLAATAAQVAPGQFTEMADGNVHGARGYCYSCAGTSHFVVFSQASGAWQCGPWSSDAHVFYCCLEDARITRIAMIAGRFAKGCDQLLVAHRSAAERFEWLNREGAVTAFSSHPDALEFALEHSPELAAPAAARSV